MKRILLILFILSVVGVSASAKTTVTKTNDKKVKVENKHVKYKARKTATPAQKVHNLVHPKRKKYSGVKIKREVKKEG